jgi:hypothetical protein
MGERLRKALKSGGFVTEVVKLGGNLPTEVAEARGKKFPGQSNHRFPGAC